MSDKQTQLIDDGPTLALAGLTHRVRLPSGAGPHPTVVMVHGWKGDEDVMWIFARSLPPGWLVVAPRAILPDPAGGHTWYSLEPMQKAGLQWPTLPLFDDAVAALTQFIEALPALYGADLAQVYAMGFSQGAAAAFAAALRRPDLIQGLASLVGFAPGVGSYANGLLRDRPVFMAVGRQDPSIPLTQAQAGRAVLEMAEANLEYHEYDTGHKLNSAGMADLKAWWRARAAQVG